MVKKIDYEGAWSRIALNWSPKLNQKYIGDQWIGKNAGAANSLSEYNQLIETKFIRPYIEKTDRVVELGVGGGKTAALLLGYAQQLVCADISDVMLKATCQRLGEERVRYTKIDGKSLEPIGKQWADVFFCYDTLVHIEPRDIFNYMTQIPDLLRPDGKRLCILHHANILSPLGWSRFLSEWESNLMGRSGSAFSVMTDNIMENFLSYLGYKVLIKDTTSVPRDCVWVCKAPPSVHLDQSDAEQSPLAPLS